MYNIIALIVCSVVVSTGSFLAIWNTVEGVNWDSFQTYMATNSSVLLLILGFYFGQKSNGIKTNNKTNSKEKT